MSGPVANRLPAVAAIDFGAWSTKVAIRSVGDSPRLVETDRKHDIRSAVYLAADSSMLAGDRAYRSRGREPARVCTRLKQLVNAAGPTPPLKRRVYFGGLGSVALVDAAAELLKLAYGSVRKSCGGPVGRVALTHPVAWGKPELEFLTRAAVRAGIDAYLDLVTEPEAVARFFMPRSPALPIAVFDIGASTFDTTILTPSPSGRAVVQFTDGRLVGGDDFDAALLDVIAARFGPADRCTLDRLLEDPASTMIDEIRSLKERLSTADRATFANEGLPDVMVYRDDFEDAIQPLVESCLIAMDEGVRELPGGRLGTVALSGGSSRVRLVHALVAEYAERNGAKLVQVTESGVGPGQLVALGAVEVPRPVTIDVRPTLTPRVGRVVALPSAIAYGSSMRTVTMARIDGTRLVPVGSGAVGGPLAMLRRLAYDSRQNRVATGTDNGLVETWEEGSGALKWRGYVGPSFSVLGSMFDRNVVALGAHNGWLAWVGWNKAGAVYHRASDSWRHVRSLDPGFRPEAVGFADSPHRLILWGGENLILYALPETECVHRRSLGATPSGIAFEPAPGRIVLTFDDGVRCYTVTGTSLSTTWERAVARPGSPACGVVDGRPVVLVHSAGDGEWVVLDGRSGAVHARRAGPVMDMQQLEYMSSGRFVACVDSLLVPVHVARGAG